MQPQDLPILSTATAAPPAEELAQFYFHQGTSARAYALLGSHRIPGGQRVFRVWAPNAEYVALCGDFNTWDPEAHPLRRLSEEGIWEGRLPADLALPGHRYKYFLSGQGREAMKADPFATVCEDAPNGASVIEDGEVHPWRDAGWLAYRKGRFGRDTAKAQAINIYEVDPLTWQRDGSGEPLSYPTLGRELASYAKQMGYTHVELLSPGALLWESGAVRGLYAPLSRQGGPAALMELVDSLHEAGIGVILGWNPLWFPTDEPGLHLFDGTDLYGSEQSGAAPAGTRAFALGRPQVRSYLISCAAYWAERYHVDGLHLPSISPLLYLDYGKGPGEWTPNRYGDSRDLDAMDFFRQLNARMAADYPDVMMITEETSGWSNVTGSAPGSLGFTLLWQRRWQTDALNYLKEDPLWRHYHHEKLLSPLRDAPHESYLLPLSHTEVGLGRPSLLERSPGSYEQKFAGVRTFLTYLMTHPGKKLLFMGSEYGVFRPWRPEQPPEWFMTDFEIHARLQRFVAALNHFYLEQPPLWELDGRSRGFAWIDANNREQSVYSYRRADREGRELIILLNFLPVKREEFRLAVPWAGVYEEVFNSDAPAYGGQGILNPGKYKTEPYYAGEHGHAIRVTVPPTGALIFRCVERAPRKTATRARNG